MDVQWLQAVHVCSQKVLVPFQLTLEVETDTEDE